MQLPTVDPKSIIQRSSGYYKKTKKKGNVYIWEAGETRDF